MGIIDSITRAVKNKEKEVKMKNRKKRQVKKQKQAKKRGDTKAVARYAQKKKTTNKKRGKAQKEFMRGVGQTAKQVGNEVAKQGIKKAVMFV